MKIIIPTIILLCTFASQALLCNTPQRSGIFSFEALSGRDHLTNVFNQINLNMSKYNLTLKISGVDYSLINFAPQFYYNDNNQVQLYVDDFNVNVTGGKLTMAYTFNYSYGQGTNNSKGVAFGRVLTNDFYFVKKTTIVNGYFQWAPVLTPDISISLLMSIQSSNPKLPDDVKSIYQNILNSFTGEQNKLKENVLAELNTLFKQYLRSYLNSEDLINSNNIIYNWRGNNVSFTNLVYNYSLSNIGFKGLQYFFLFELEDFTTQCNNLTKDFDLELGGIQEVLGLEFMRAGVFYGLKKGWFDTNLGPKWETEIFQFYMGDVANVIDQAMNYPAMTPVTGECHWDPSIINLTMSYFNPTSIYFTIPYACNLKTNGKLIQSLSFNATFVVGLSLAADYLDTKITYTGIVDLKFIPAGDFVVSNQNTALASYYVLKVLRTLEGTRTYGAGFPTLFRKFPLLKVTKDYIVMYDPSQI